MKIFWHILILSVLLSSCRKKDFPETVPDPQGDFHFSGTIAGAPVSLKAGLENYYMYSSHALDHNGLYSFTADLKPSGCTGCKNSLRVTINNYRYASLNEAVKIDSAIAPKYYTIQGAPYYAVQFRSHFNKQAASYFWDFGDKSSSSQADPVHIYNTPGNYSVSLRINSSNGCQQFISNIEKIRYPAVGPRIAVASGSADSMSFTGATSGSSAYRYMWHFGDGDTSSIPNPSHKYKIAGTYPVSLRLIDAQLDTTYARYNVATKTDPMPCLTNYSIESVTRVGNPLPFSNIIIDWTDENGEVYTSNNMLQPEASRFKILSVEDYEPNERGEKTKKIRVSFTCHVYNGSRAKLIENGEAVLAVSYR